MDILMNDKEHRRPNGDEPPEDASGPQTANSVAVRRDPDVWFPDGNIVIKAQDVAFRVHKSVLALHSEVFKDIFLASSSSSNSSNPTEIIDDCPVVNTPDNPNDLRHLFLVLCCGKNYYCQDDELQAVPFDVLDSLIRMGHKYCVRNVLRDALARLQKYYSNSPSAWSDDTKRTRYVAAPEPRSAIQTITSLAPLTNTPSLLPSSFLTCCGHVDTLITDFAGTSAGPLRMSSDELLRVINGRAAVTRAGVDHIVGLATIVAPMYGCSNQHTCLQAARWSLLDHERDSSLNDMQRYTAAFTLFHERFWGTRMKQLCNSCLSAAKQKDEERCRESWLQLPAMFKIEVPGWPDRTELPT